METVKIAAISTINKHKQIKLSNFLTRGHFGLRILLVTSQWKKIGVMYRINVLFKKKDGEWLKFKNRELQ